MPTLGIALLDKLKTQLNKYFQMVPQIPLKWCFSTNEMHYMKLLNGWQLLSLPFCLSKWSHSLKNRCISLIYQYTPE